MCVFLRCLRDFEKWSWIGKMGEKWGKKLVLKSAIIHYSCSLQYYVVQCARTTTLPSTNFE